MLKIEINNQTALRFQGARLNLLGQKVIQLLKLKGSYQVSLAVVGARQMQNLNKRYRRQDRVTDVLSFGDNEKLAGETFLGEIVICSAKVQSQAKTFKCSKQAETERLFLHGFLHLLGYDHEKKSEAQVMESLEQKIIKSSNH